MGDAQPQERAIPTPEESGGSLRLSRRPGPPRGTGIPGVLREVRESGGNLGGAGLGDPNLPQPWNSGLQTLLNPWPSVVDDGEENVMGATREGNSTDAGVDHREASSLQFCTFVTCPDGQGSDAVCENPQTVNYGTIHVTVEALLDLLVGAVSGSCTSCGGRGWGHVRWFVGGGVAIRVEVVPIDGIDGTDDEGCVERVDEGVLGPESVSTKDGGVHDELGHDSVMIWEVERPIDGPESIFSSVERNMDGCGVGEYSTRGEARRRGVPNHVDPRLEVRQVLAVLRRLAMELQASYRYCDENGAKEGSVSASLAGTILWCVARRGASVGLRFEAGSDAGVVTRVVLPSRKTDTDTTGPEGWRRGEDEEVGREGCLRWVAPWIEQLVGADMDVDVAKMVGDMQDGEFSGWDRLHWEYAGEHQACEEGSGTNGAMGRAISRYVVLIRSFSKLIHLTHLTFL